MKIAQVSPYDYPYPGGVQEHIHYLDKHLRRLGHEVWILAPSSADEDELQGNVIKVSGAVHPLPFSGSVARVSLSPRVYHRVKRILREGQFDIVHLHEPMSPILPLAVLRHSKAINVGTFHAYRESHAIYEYGKRLFEPFFERLDGRIAVSEAALDTVARYFPGEYTIIPNGIDVERFGGPSVEPLPRYMDGKLNILFVGRLEKRKGFRYLLRAFPYVKAALPQARLLVVGAYDKDDKKPFVRYARRHRLRDVKFIGYAPAEEIPRYYRTAHLFCAPSTGFESFGIVLLEAMASGVPIVASDIPGYRCVLTHGREGLLVEPESERALAEAIIRLLRDPDLCQWMGQQGRAKACQYSWEKIARRVLDYYEELLVRRRSDVREQARAERSFRELAAKVSGWLDPRERGAS
ncbi:MAG TPA: glycosyltransferase family 1 protein [Anaerolineae bacterium]|nr:glycosyltransferase family 1 protein [Anaerolineae bacterium]